MRLGLAVVLALALVSSGCTVGRILPWGSGPYDQPKAEDLDKLGGDAYVEALLARGMMPVRLEVMFPDLSPAPHVTVQAVDTAFRRYQTAVNDQGVGPLMLRSLSVPDWRIEIPGAGWVRVNPPTFYPDDEGQGLRAVLLAVPLVTGGAEAELPHPPAGGPSGPTEELPGGAR